MPRRCYHIRLDAKMSNPFKGREFKHPDLLQWTMENRGRLLHALLVMARAWYSAGRKKKVKDALGSFEAWHQTVGSILAYCGVEGFLGNMNRFLEEADDTANQWEAFLLTIADHYPKAREFTVAELVERMTQSEPLRLSLPDALSDDRKGLDLRKRIGNAFSRRRDQRFGDLGVYLKRGVLEGHKKIANWKVIVPAIDGEEVT